MNKKDAKQFAEQWLPAWTGNQPELLLNFYAEDAFYLDPGIPNGVKGKVELSAYFAKLLAQNPNWIWEQIEPIPMEKGFLNKWLAKIPVGNKIIECIGVCLVHFNEQGEIERNEVYFDRTTLVEEIFKLKNQVK